MLFSDFVVAYHAFFLRPGSTVHCMYDVSLPETLVKTLAKSLAKKLVKSLAKK